jgi:hypothetical protein
MRAGGEGPGGPRVPFGADADHHALRIHRQGNNEPALGVRRRESSLRARADGRGICNELPSVAR